MAEIFINYRTGDETYAALLLDEKLCERLGPDAVFRDNRSIGLGLDFRPILWRALARSAVLVVVIGPRWLARDATGRRRIDDPADFVRREIALGLQVGIRVIPVLVGPAVEPGRADLPADIAGLASQQYIRLHDRGAQHDIARLVEEIARIVTAGRAATSTHRGGPDGTADPVVVAPAPSPCTGAVALLEIEHFDAAGSAEARAGLRACLREAVAEAAGEARLDGVDVTDRVSSQLLSAPGTYPPVRFVASFAGALDRSLRRRAGDGGPRDLQVRLAVHIGVFNAAPGVPDAVDEVEHLAAGPLLGAVLGRARRAHVAVVVSDRYFQDVVLPNRRLVDRAAYLPDRDEDGEARGWVYVPGYPAPPGVPSTAATPAPAPAGAGPAGAGPARPAGVRVTGGVHDHAVVAGGDYVGGDYVAGDSIRHYHGPGPS